MKDASRMSGETQAENTKTERRRVPDSPARDQQSTPGPSPETPPRNYAVSWSSSLRFMVFGLVIVVAAVVFWSVRKVFEPLIIAAFTAYLINPAVEFLHKRTRLSRSGAVNLVFIVTLLLLIGTPASFTTIFFDEVKQVITDIIHLFNQVLVWLQGLQGSQFFSGIPIDFGQLSTQLTQFSDTFTTTLPSTALHLIGKTSEGAVWVIIILVAMYFILSKWPELRDGFINSFPDRYAPEIKELYRRLRRIWMGFLRSQIVLMLIVGVAFSIAWTVIGLPGALALGVVAGFLTIIPDVGPFIAVMLAIAVGLLEGSNWAWMPSSHLAVGLIALAVYLVLISFKNFWIRPLIMGRSVEMNEALVLVSILIATILWGILGALVIVPVLASLFVIVDYLRRRIFGMTPFPPVEPFVSQEVIPTGQERLNEIKTRISRRKKE
jgi:predicted PurR-regulated permease PerM